MSDSPKHEIGVDVCEEYANAFRTASYIDFWTRVTTYSDGESTSGLTVDSTTAARLPSYRLFAEHLLDPDQPTVTQVLLSITHYLPPIIHSLISEYFAQTANASFLCSLLLKDIDRIRVQYRSLKTILQVSNLSTVMTRLVKLSNSLSRVRATQSQCCDLLKRLELRRDKVRTKLRLIAKLKCGSAFFLVTITSSLIVVVLAHGLALLVAVPGFVVSLMDLASEKKLARVMTQLDAATKGTYILNKDLETISQLMARLNDEMEHMRTVINFWVERKEDQFQANGEVAQLMKKSQCSLSDQLDELEEHLYLCFMNINRARDLVFKQIMDPGHLRTHN
ncbi:UPF0496 protein [Senna tora]|uniref:UPF0496 protein n=1 Tax=Senna tora TaxID=362788 RepID=A0A834WFY2_9FABA|nr:UPF0496 protein [Senna tora]